MTLFGLRGMAVKVIIKKKRAQNVLTSCVLFSFFCYCDLSKTLNDV